MEAWPSPLAVNLRLMASQSLKSRCVDKVPEVPEPVFAQTVVALVAIAIEVNARAAAATKAGRFRNAAFVDVGTIAI